MTRNEEHSTENNSNLNTISEIRSKRFNVTLEISLFVIVLSSSLTDAAISNILLYRTCVHSLNHSTSECHVFISLDKNNDTQHLEKEVQKYVTFVSTVKSIIESLTPAVLSLFIGVWSDTHGRKPLMVWPTLGISFSAMLLVIYSMLHNYGPWWYILTIIPYSVTGGFTVLMTGAFCYLSDVTSTENRSIRMAVLGGFFSAGAVIGGLLSAQVLKAVGNVYLLLIGATLNVFTYALLNIFLEESLIGAVEGNMSTVLNFMHLKEMAYECFKKRPNNGRAQIILLALANSLALFIMVGVSDLEYLYVRQKVNWILKDYTVYSSVNTTISFVGTFIGFAILQNLFKIGDLALATIAFISAVCDYAIRSIAVRTWHMYLGAATGLFKQLSAPLIRSFMTKIVPLEDTAKVFALMAAIEGFCPLLAPLLYNSVYEFSITSFPPAIYVLSCGIFCVCITFLGIVQYIRWKMTPVYQRINSEEYISS